MHVVSPWGTRQRLVLARQAVGEKANEIVTIPLLERLHLVGAFTVRWVLTMGAGAGCDPQSQQLEQDSICAPCLASSLRIETEFDIDLSSGRALPKSAIWCYHLLPDERSKKNDSLSCHKGKRLEEDIMTMNVPEIVFVRDGSIVTESFDLKNCVAWERLRGSKTSVSLPRADAGTTARHRRTTILRLRETRETFAYWEADLEGDYALCEIRIYRRRNKCIRNARPLLFFGRKGASRWELIADLAGSEIFQKSGHFIMVHTNPLCYRFLRLEINMSNCTAAERSEICKESFLIVLFLDLIID